MSSSVRRDRALLVAIVIVTLMAVTILASGLSSVEIKSSRQLSFDAVQQAADLANLTMPSSAVSALSFLAGLLRVVMLLLLPFSVYYFVKSPNARKRVLVQLVYLVGFAYLILALSKSLGQAPDQPGFARPPVDPAAVPPPGIFSTITDTPSWVFFITSAAITLLIAAIAIQVYRRMLAPDKQEYSAEVEARRALDALERGADLEGVIFRTYRRLCAVSSDRFGLRRHRAMTPMEYEGALARSGVPESPLARLTRLFERARYGSAALSSEDEQEAIAALRMILGEES
ncbi:MAG: DUF4129 domain-containing protein [Anaerolineales bacterium]